MANTGPVWAFDFGKGLFSFAANPFLTTNEHPGTRIGYRLFHIGHRSMALRVGAGRGELMRR